jgi:integrase
MAIEKVGIYRKWLGPVPEDKNGEPVPESEWPRKRRHRWIARWYGTNGQRYGKVFKTRKEAQKYASELQKRVCLGKADNPKKVTLHEFRLEHEQVMKGQVAYGTIQEHMRALKFFENYIGGSIVLSKIQPPNAEAFIAHRLASGCSPSTANKDIGTLHRIFNLTIKPRGYLAEGQNPFAQIKKRKVTENPNRYVEISEYRALMNAAKDLWWETFLSIAYGSGLRRNEILHLIWMDIDFGTQRINVTANKATAELIGWEPKNRKNRIVPMSDETAQLLVNMQAKAPEGHPYVFVSPERLVRIKERRRIGKWNSRSELINNVARKFTKIRCEANVAKCTIHDFRRSAITNWAQQLPIQLVQTLAGHADISTTRKYYLTVRSEDMASANKVVNSILAKSSAN